MHSLIAIATICCCASIAIATSIAPQCQSKPKLICKTNEIIDPCPRTCPPEPNCDQYLNNIQYLCAEEPPGTPCVPACRCANGLVRNKNGICIDPKNCCDDENAEVVDCPNPCQPTCENPITGNCTETFCQLRGCQCKKGYVLHNGKCIKLDQCPYPPTPACPGPNEVYVSCKDPCPETCDSLFQSGPKPQCLPPYPCPAGCNCAVGYVRDKNNKCIKKEDCPPPLVCKENEVLNLCAKPCVPGEMQYCYEYLRDKANDCEPSPKFPCELRCDCVPGYLRNDQGICVKKENCCQDPNEVVVDCPDPCPLSCDNLDTHGKFPCTRACVVRGCACREGYVRDSNNKCIPRDQCPKPIQCKLNEVLNPCPGYCTFEDDCGAVVFGFIRDCAAPPPDYQCQPRCECKRGLVRIGQECLSVEKCCTGINEEITDCPSPCDETCEGKPAADCQLSPCFKKGCRCKAGFMRDDKNVCVTKSQCPSCSGPYEVFKFRGTPCQPTCDNRSPSCTKNTVSGCFCIDGYIRDKDNKCIPIDDCPKPCTGENEEYTTCGGCDPTCDNPDLVCKIACQKGCFCKKGFVRDANNKCIDPKMCPAKCKENEEYKTCGSCDPTCDNLNPICTAVCKQGCFCKAGFVRDAKGNCIAAKMCPQKQCTGPNEEYTDCVPCGPTANCVCKPGCVCKAGFVRKNGVCTKETEPIKCTGANEEYSECINPCPPGAMCIAACIPGCVCKKGFVRKDGVCVKETPQNQCTGPNEEFTDCLPCPPGQICPAVCRPGCVCKAGFVRKNGVCTKETEPIKCTGPNEEYNECVPCGPTDRCVCRPGCQCKPGFVRKNGVCTKETEPIKCTGPNEEYSECTNPCPPGAMCRVPCIPGCVCKKGFERKNGVCVPDYGTTVPTTKAPTTTTKAPTTTTKAPTTTTKAPTTTQAPVTCGRYETYTNCMPEREATCENRSAVAAKVCKPGCECMPGYFRNMGKCIPAKDCKTSPY